MQGSFYSMECSFHSRLHRAPRHLLWMFLLLCKLQLVASDRLNEMVHCQKKLKTSSTLFHNSNPLILSANSLRMDSVKKTFRIWLSSAILFYERSRLYEQKIYIERKTNCHYSLQAWEKRCAARQANRNSAQHNLCMAEGRLSKGFGKLHSSHTAE